MIKIKKILKELKIFYLVLLQVRFVFPQIQSHIVGGKLTTIKEVPYLVRLLEFDILRCGGTLVAPKFVVTAAHCIANKKIETFTVVAGVTHSFQMGVRSKVKKIMIPKRYVDAERGLDVAVLKLYSPVNSSHIQPIGLCKTYWRPFAEVQIYGWGKVNETAVKMSNQLRTATVQVLEKNTCAYMYRNRINLTKTMFCASTPGRKDSCIGDSGGPGIINGQFCGIISGGYGCARRKYPGVLTDVRAVRRFITNSILK